MLDYYKSKIDIDTAIKKVITFSWLAVTKQLLNIANGNHTVQKLALLYIVVG